MSIDSGYTQIADTEDPYDFYKALSPESSTGEVIGRIAFLAASFSAGGAFVPAVLKKRRVYTFSPAVANAPQQQEIGVEEVVEAPTATPRSTPLECEKIRELFTSIADGGVNLAFPWVIIRLKQLGNEIDHVHPFSLFLAMPKEKIREILLNENPLKINGVIGGIRKGMLREIERNRINRYTADFAASIGKQEERIKQLIQAADWLGLAQYLFDIPVARTG